MERSAWPKVFAYLGVAVIGLALAYYATAVATGGITAGLLGRSSGEDLLNTGSVALLVGVATMAVFGYLALKLSWSLVRKRGSH